MFGKKRSFGILIILAALALLIMVWRQQNVSFTPNSNITAPSVRPTVASPTTNSFVPPLTQSAQRITKKKFGTFVTPQNSLVQPERFSGFHTGVDFEVFPEEINTDVPVKAICAGILKLKELASGYGGVAVQQCHLDSQPITVIYGHLKLSSISKNVGESIVAGEMLGLLGRDHSSETDGERKHLHLGIHKGSAVDIRGYVNPEALLSGWLDPCQYVCD